MTRLKGIGAALERIDYNTRNSPLFLRLTEIFQECLDAVADERPKSGSNLWIGRLRDIEKILKRMGLESKIRTVLKSTLNMDLYRLYIDTTSASPNAWIYPEPKGFNLNDILVLREAGAGVTKTSESVSKKVKAAFELMGSGVNDKTGSYNDLTRKAIRVHLCLCASLFDLHAFHPVVSDLTAGEIAAIAIHEIGHAVTLVEEMASFSYRTTVIRDTVRYMSEKATPKDVAEITAYLEKKIAGSRSAPLMAVQAKQAIANLSRDNDDEDVDRNVKSFIVFDVLVHLLISVYVNAAAQTVEPAVAGSRKISDLRNTTRNAVMYERMADEFASRNGAGGDLSTALGKLYKIQETGAIVLFAKYSAASRALYYLGVAVATPFRILTPPFAALASPYESDRKRLIQIQQDLMSLFKDPDLPAEVRDDALANIQTIRSSLEQYDSNIVAGLRQFIWGTLLRMTSQSTLIGSITNGNVAGDYYHLLNSVEDLIRQPLYHQAARLAQLQSKQ